MPPERRRRSGTPEHTEVQRPILLVTEPAEPRPAASIRIVPRRRAEIVNRVVNIALAILALLIVAPIMLLVALAVKLTSPGPVLYKQTRVGLDRRAQRTDAIFCRRREDRGGHIFTIYKFRSMYDGAEDQTGAVWAAKDDARVTPLGRFLRASRLDEFPQLFNVIRGDMNIVGPRPERPSIFAKLREDLPEYHLRQRARPGITGWAQVNHTYDTSVADVRVKVRYDLEYLERQSIAEDLRIMLRTVPVMLFRRGGW